MRILNILWLVIFMLGCTSQSEKSESLNKATQQRSHDLNLPAWGPYTKKYIGVSHIPDIEKGLRFDLSIFPGLTDQKTVVPNVMKKSSFHPWEASPNLEFFSFRHDLIWKDEVFADISYSEIDAQARSFKIDYTNNTNEPQSVTAQLMASLHFPPLKPHDPETRINYSTVVLPQNAVWVDAIDYNELNFAIPGHRNQLVYDGMLRGEIRDHHLVNGSGIGKGFGRKSGDEIKYSFTIPKAIKDAKLLIRYKTEKPEEATIVLTGIVETDVKLEGTETLKIKEINIGNLMEGTNELHLKTKSKTRLNIDGFAIVSNQDIEKLKFEPLIWKGVPEIIEGPLENSLILKYENTDTYYGVYWDQKDFLIRQWFSKDLPANLHEYDQGEKTLFDGDKEGHFTNVFIKPIELSPNSSKSLNGLVCQGTKKEVINRLRSAKGMGFQEVYQAARKNIPINNVVPSGEKYVFSQNRMAANTICNVVYPVYTQGQYIRHHAPGRKWDCLYTWDAGFIGIGLSQLSYQRGVENLEAYLNETDEQSAFIHHGTMLPVQFYLFQELWNKTQSEDLVADNYLKLKRYYEFLIGRIDGSTTRNLDSGLIRTWDYFYNSGGWDDYPAQKYIHENKLTKNVTPVVSTSHVIRAAKILQQAALHLGLDKDIDIYANDIVELTNALQEHSWDEKSGYFGYVVHNTFDNPTGILKFEDNLNYNMGLGGASPLVAGASDKLQTEKLVSHLKTKGEIWSNVGLSTVDQTAPYYNKDGYWNGKVWMPHQWFFWRAMLDLGEAEFAYKIANTGLEVWKRETEKDYNCYEYFSIETEIGKGWHQFSGLSTPVMSWFNAYYKMGNLTTGYDVWIEEKEFNKGYSSLSAKLRMLEHKSESFSIVVCLNPQFEYDVFWNNDRISHKEFNKGTLSITIQDKSSIGILTVEKRQVRK
jgi:hypothetical protein